MTVFSSLNFSPRDAALVCSLRHVFINLSNKFYIASTISNFIQQNISILVVLMYSWQISVNMKKYQSLGDVYYGKRSVRAKRRRSIWIPKANLRSVDFPFCFSFICAIETRRAGVQIAYYAIIFSQFSMMVLSVLLAIGVYTVSSFSFWIGTDCDKICRKWLPRE